MLPEPQALRARKGANARTSDATKPSPKHATKARDPSTPVNSPDPGQIRQSDL